MVKGRCGLDSSVSGNGPVAGCCVHGNKPSGSIKSREFLDYVSGYQLLKKDSAPWD